MICSSWFSLTVAASPAFASLTSSDILFYRSQKIILKTLKSVRGVSETACRLLSLCKQFRLPR